MNSYLITLKPLEPYFFGGEQNFDFGETKRQTQSKYFIKSESVPSQTTLFGVLRYVILEKNNCLFDTWTAADKEKKKTAKELTGEKSFSFEEEREFGKIKNISPLFLTDNNGKYYIKTPLNHNRTAGKYTPFKMKEATDVTTGNGVNLFPEDYDAKIRYDGGYVCLDSELKTTDNKNIFEGMIKIGINANRNRKSENNEKSFFKREFKILKDPFCFAFFTEADTELPGKTLIYMGQSKSAFSFEAKCMDNNLISETKKHLTNLPEIKDDLKNKFGVFYALSDIRLSKDMVTENYKFKYYIADTKMLRYLSTDVNGSCYYNRLIKSESLYKLICAGSIFYTDDIPDFANDEISKKIGLNSIIKIGG